MDTYCKDSVDVESVIARAGVDHHHWVVNDFEGDGVDIMLFAVIKVRCPLDVAMAALRLAIHEVQARDPWRVPYTLSALETHDEPTVMIQRRVLYPYPVYALADEVMQMDRLARDIERRTLSEVN